MDKISCEICYVANNNEQFTEKITISAGSKIEDALKQSTILRKFNELSLSSICCGIYSKKTTLDHIIENKDRIEIYRPLKITPMEARRLRAKKAMTE